MESELNRLATEVWDEELLLGSIDRFRSQAETAPWTSGGDADALSEELRAWVRDRPATITALLVGGVPAGEDEQAACLSDGGDGDQECPEDFDPDKPCEDGDKCILGDVWWYCDSGEWVAY
jgi:hypothetical protein